MALVRSIVLLVLASALAVFLPGSGARAADSACQAGAGTDAAGHADVTAARPCRQDPREDAAVFEAAVHVAARGAPAFSLIAYSPFSSERPASFAAALLSQTPEAGCRLHDAWGRPASLSGSTAIGPFGGAAAAHARL